MVSGRVKIQATTMRPIMRQRIALRRLVAPTPMIDVEITWVVDNGMPHMLAKRIIRIQVLRATPKSCGFAAIGWL